MQEQRLRRLLLCDALTWFSLSRQQSDWQAAVAFARQSDGVDPARVVLWGCSGTTARMISRALRETITRQPVTMPVAGKPGDFAVLPAPEALPGFEHITAGRPWRNEVSTSWLFPLAAFRPVTTVPRERFLLFSPPPVTAAGKRS